MLTLVPEAIEAYALAHTTRTREELFQRLAAQTRAASDMPQMQVGAIEGRLLALLVRLSGARRALEIGTFTGCSALHIADALPAGGRLVTLDVDPATGAIAQAAFDEAGLSDRIERRLGPAAELIPTLEGPFDFVFIDADKVNYPLYWELVVPKVRPGGLIVADNVLWSGKVVDPKEPSDHALVAFNARVRSDPRVDQVMLTVRDGVTLAVVR